MKHSTIGFIIGAVIIISALGQHALLDEHSCINEIDEAFDGIFHYHETEHIGCSSVTLLDPTDFNHIPVYFGVLLIVLAIYLKTKNS